MKPDAELNVVVGSILLKSGGIKYQVSKIIIHPDYNYRRGYDDIAILITSEAITTSSSVGFIALPSGTTGAGINVTLTGWGWTIVSLVRQPNSLLRHIIITFKSKKHAD